MNGTLVIVLILAVILLAVVSVIILVRGKIDPP